jgi:hypothetical protein
MYLKSFLQEQNVYPGIVVSLDLAQEAFNASTRVRAFVREKLGLE